VVGTIRDARRGEASLINTVKNESYTLSYIDSTINVDTEYIKKKCILTLPEILTIKQKRYHITDSTGRAGTYNIVIVPSGSNTIMGQKSFTINSNYSSISLYNDEIYNWILY
jgi:hypothetical protein